MDLEWRVDYESEATFIEDEDCTIDSVFEQERCGICIDIVIDRGALDCCEHWFCFVCIDNWATITNLCPICRKEFQLITCLPVYDTIQSIRSEEHPLSGSEDWSIQEKNNTLTFPSYYISEDAVRCLENDGCKIRSGLQATEEDLCIDTSIACDSCDIWYHAYCVGFNPEFTSENSWLCPRCIDNEVPQKSGAISLQGPGKDSTPESAEVGWTIEPSLSGKLSVSVADDGETAVVVSMIEENQKTDCKMSVLDKLDSNMEQVITTFSPYSDFLNSETDVHLKDGSCMQISDNDMIFSDYKELYTTASDVDNISEYFFDISPEIIDFQSVDDLKEATVSSFSQCAGAIKPRGDITEAPSQPSTLQDIPFSLCYSESSDNDMHINTLEITSDSVPNSSFMTCSTSEGKNEPDKKCSEKTYLGFSDFSSLQANNMVASCDNDMVADLTHNSKEASNSTEKPKMNRSNIINAGEVNDCIRKRELEAVYPVKKLKSDGKPKILPPGSLTCFSSLDSFQVCPSNSRSASLGLAKQEEADAPDIMSIVQESDSTSHIPTEMKAANNSIDKKDNTFGVRVKKIMRRVEKKKESSILAQELGKEIREVVQQKALKDIGKNNDFDEKLLAAFRAAIARSKTELTDRSEVTKKPFLMKGKNRENLTKKIYGTGSGRRRHAWVRDLEIDFWKHRCRKKQPAKVETLQSVLELLKQATNLNWNSSMERVSEEEATDSVLSRVYIADASLFPRKDDIKPLSAFAGMSQLDIHNLNKEKSFGIESKEPLIYENNFRKNSMQNSKSSLQLTANSSDSIGKKIHAPCFPGEASIQKANSRGAAIKSSGSNCSKGSMPTSKEHDCSSDVKSDKKKWALEVLARKNASTNMNANKGQDDNVLLKDKYPLLAQLPLDMRPVLASSPLNKVPLSVRRAQLYRITEYYLRRSNITFIHRTAVTELAVADAVNIEKEISERSNSKLVYVNLCSQAVSQHANKPESAEINVSNSPMAHPKAANEVAEDTNSDPETGNKQEAADRIVSNSAKFTSKADSEVPEGTTSDPKTGGWSNVEEALKMAGLFSDSPPSSPCRATKDSNEDKAVEENVEEECLNCDAHGNVMDMKQDASICQSPGNEALVYDCINLAVKPPFDFSNSLRQTKEIEPENSKEEFRMDDCLPITISEMKTFNDPSLEECDRNVKESQINQTSNEAVEVLKKPLEATEANISTFGVKEKCVLKDGTVFDTKSCISGSADGSTPLDETSARRDPETHSRVINPVISDYIPIEEMDKEDNEESELIISTSKKVEAYIKEHIRPLCKSGVITVEQYRWAVGKTLDKVMKFHHKAKNANFLIREGEKVKKLAEQYVEAAQRKDMRSLFFCLLQLFLILPMRGHHLSGSTGTPLLPFQLSSPRSSVLALILHILWLVGNLFVLFLFSSENKKVACILGAVQQKRKLR